VPRLPLRQPRRGVRPRLRGLVPARLLLPAREHRAGAVDVRHARQVLPGQECRAAAHVGGLLHDGLERGVQAGDVAQHDQRGGRHGPEPAAHEHAPLPRGRGSREHGADQGSAGELRPVPRRQVQERRGGFQGPVSRLSRAGKEWGGGVGEGAQRRERREGAKRGSEQRERTDRTYRESEPRERSDISATERSEGAAVISRLRERSANPTERYSNLAGTSATSPAAGGVQGSTPDNPRFCPLPPQKSSSSSSGRLDRP
jgi:hypothetical protein